MQSNFKFFFVSFLEIWKVYSHSISKRKKTNNWIRAASLTSFTIVATYNFFLLYLETQDGIETAIRKRERHSWLFLERQSLHIVFSLFVMATLFLLLLHVANWITRDWKVVCTAQNETLEEQDCNCIGTIPIPGIRRMKRKIHPREIQLNKQIKIKGIIHIWSKWLMSRLWRTTCFDGGLWQWRYITDAHSIRPSPYDNCHQ